MDMTTALETIGQWPAAQQIEFVQQVWDRLVESGWQPTLTAAQKAELDHRLAAYEAEPTNVLTWDEVAAHLRRPR